MATSLSANAVHRNLCQAVAVLREAEGVAVTWFAELRRRGLFRDLGYGSIYEYAEKELEFSERKTTYFIQLARSIDTMPTLKNSLEEGRTSWTKAREVVSVATPKTEARWTEIAETSSQRELTMQAKRARARAKAQGKRRAETNLFESAESPAGTAGAGFNCGDAKEEKVPQAKVRVNLSMEFSPEEYARYAALLESLQKSHTCATREEIVLQAFEALAMASPITNGSAVTGSAKPRATGAPGPGPTETAAGSTVSGGDAGPDPAQAAARRGDTRSPYRVVIQYCPTHDEGTVNTPKGPRTIEPEVLRAILCDAVIQGPEGRNKATIPPRLRRRVLARDHHTCCTRGCNNTRFLQVHHLYPREGAGENTMENLITLCSSCHRWAHAAGEAGVSNWPEAPTGEALPRRQAPAA